LSAEAHAVEREHRVGIDGGLSLLSIQDKGTMDVGVGAGAHYVYGLTDQFNLMVEGAWSVVAANQQQDNKDSPHTRPASISFAGAGVGYVLDILRWIPYGGVLLDSYYLYGGTLDTAKIFPGVELALGLDYRFNRSFTAGVSFRQHLLVTVMDKYPSFTNLFARVEYAWGW
jgi:hypothetical protein